MGILETTLGRYSTTQGGEAVEAGRQVVLVNPPYTSQDCSNPNCRRRHTLSLSDRWFACECGLSIDRDVNAALNILWVGQTHWDATWLNRASVSQEAPPLHRTCGSVQV